MTTDLGAYVGSGNTKKEKQDDDWMPGTYRAQHRSRLGAPMLRVGGGLSVVQLEPSKMGDLEPAPAEATAGFTHTPVTSDTPLIVATHFTAALPTLATKRRSE